MGVDTSLIFSRTGPSFLTALNWNESQHRRSVAASLVQGVFALERDRQENRNGVGPPWWQFFNFRLVQNLVDQVDASHFGAVYEFIDFPGHGHCHNHRPPQFVVAFRGSSNRFANWEQDLNLNLLLSLDTIQSSSRVQRGLESARRFVREAGPENVWLAGHSIGSSLALAVGRQMAKQGHYLETYLFNPPFSSPPIGRLTSNQLKFGLRLANSLLTAALATAAARCNQGQEADTFFELSTWFPYLFINPSDPICSEYVGYFKHREDMESIGAGEIERIATKHSKRSIVLKDCEPVHRIPSAHLILNLTPSNSFKEAHGIHQWWRQDLQFHYEYHHYQYKSIALLVGKQMVKSGFHLETYLYNPPFASPHIERIKNEKVKQGLRFSNSLLTACIAAAVCHKSQDRESDPFVVLSSWIPYAPNMLDISSTGRIPLSMLRHLSILEKLT